jgi:hypothetical protein
VVVGILLLLHHYHHHHDEVEEKDHVVLFHAFHFHAHFQHLSHDWIVFDVDHVVHHPVLNGAIVQVNVVVSEKIYY